LNDQFTCAVLATPVALVVDNAGNGVYQPNETAVVAPSWMNTGATAMAFIGTFTNHTGPAGATYAIPDGTADYGTVAAGATASCTATGNCYSVANVATARPATHWDSTVDEAIAGTSASKTWTLHIGDSFTDVLPISPFYRFIETILHKSVTGGCGATTYCPANTATREQMAPFVLVSKEGPGYNPPACAPPNLFTDVPETSPFCKFIEELANRGVVAGCGPNLYCPTNPVTREQMAVFVLRTLDPALNPPACGTPVFNDVPASSPFCRWIEELARRGVVTGCGGGNYCPTASVTREQMSVFLSATFGLKLYGL
jgi:S-layer family protein